MLEQILHLSQTERILDIIQVNFVVANTNLSTLETFRMHIRPYVLVVFLIFEASGVDIVFVPLGLIVVFLTPLNLITVAFLNIFHCLSPAENFNISVKQRMFHCHHTELVITYRAIDIANVIE